MGSTVNTFLAAFGEGGAALLCLEGIRAKHDMWVRPTRIGQQWQTHYLANIPKMVIEGTTVFDFSVLEGGRDCPMIKEITSTLEEIGTDKERQKRYITGLLTPLADWARVVDTQREIKRLEGEIRQWRHDKTQWEQEADTPATKEQVEACKEMIARRQGDIARLKDIQQKLGRIVGGVFEESTIEYCFNLWYRAVSNYTSILDAALLMHGLDLMEYQQLTGVHLIGERDAYRVARFVGTADLARHYIQALQKGGRKPLQKVDKVMTDRAKKYFAKALQWGLMEEEAGGYRWALNNASLAYFLMLIYNPKGCSAIPYKALEELFGVTKLAKTLAQALVAQSPQKWRARIDHLFAGENI